MRTLWRCVLGFLLVANLTYWVSAKATEQERIESENIRMRAAIYFVEQRNEWLNKILTDLQIRSEHVQRKQKGRR